MIKTKDLARLQEITNIASIARKSGLNQNTIRGKVQRGTELSVTESELIEGTFKRYGLIPDNSFLPVSD